MTSGPEKVTPQLPCPQCRELTPSDSKYCSACGADIYAECPDCGIRRGADDAFCRKCGFNFVRKKIKLKNPPPSAEPGSDLPPSKPLPQVQFHKPEQRFEYRMSPVQGAFRAILMLVFLVAIAVAVFWGAYWAWEHVTVKDLAEKFKQGPSSLFKSQFQEKNVEPDWNARSQYWIGYYRDIFAPPPTNSWVEVGLTTGIREKGFLVQITDDTVVLKKDGHELGFPIGVLDNASRQILFPDDYAAARAGVKVDAEKAEWQRRRGPAVGAASSAPPTASPLPGAAGASAPPPPPRSFLDIKCPACAGMGYCLVTGGGERRGTQGVLSSGGDKNARDDSGLQQSKKTLSGISFSQGGKEPCPVCGARGYRRFDKAPEFPWPAGAARCDKCQGMGMVWSRETQGMKQGSVTASICPLCTHRGYVVNKWDADHNVPPRYE